MSMKYAKKLARLGPRAIYGQSLLNEAKVNEQIFAISADLGNSSGLDRFKKSIPERYKNIGIMEQHAIGFASGLSTHNYNCFVSSFAPFLTMRACEQVRLNLGYMNSNVKIVALGSGVSMGYLGNSHFGLEDISIIKLIPGIPIYCPADCLQVESMVKYLSKTTGPAYLRLTGVASSPIIYETSPEINMGSIDILKEGDKSLIVGHGTILYNALVAANESDPNNDFCVVNAYNPHPLPKSLINMIQKFEKIYVVEEHRKTGGLYSSIAEYIAENNMQKEISAISLPNNFVISGSYAEIQEEYGLDISGIKGRLMR